VHTSFRLAWIYGSLGVVMSRKGGENRRTSLDVGCIALSLVLLQAEKMMNCV